MDLESTGLLQYHIITSADNVLVPQMAVSITAMAKNLKNAHILLFAPQPGERRKYKNALSPV